MTEREKVIKGLECCFDALVQEEHAFAENGVVMSTWQDRAKRIDAIREAIALLKAQEPRVMKVGDVRNWVNSDRVTREPVVIEIRGGVCAWISDDEVRELPGEENLSSDLYGVTWRCWTSRPTDKQREVVKWDA